MTIIVTPEPEPEPEAQPVVQTVIVNTPEPEPEPEKPDPTIELARQVGHLEAMCATLLSRLDALELREVVEENEAPGIIDIVMPEVPKQEEEPGEKKGFHLW